MPLADVSPAVPLADVSLAIVSLVVAPPTGVRPTVAPLAVAHRCGLVVEPTRRVRTWGLPRIDAVRCPDRPGGPDSPLVRCDPHLIDEARPSPLTGAPWMRNDHEEPP